MGRAKLPDDVIRSKQVQSRWTRQEFSDMQKIARGRYGISVSDRIRELIQRDIKQHRKFLGAL
jgi:hypothetical protein